LVAQYKD